MKLNILIVDDIHTNILYLESLLQDLDSSEDINTLHALSAKEAIDICLNTDIGLILADVEMPEMDGIEMAEVLKENSITKDIPVVFVTADDKTDEFIKDTYKLGAVDFFVKPLRKYTVIAKINLYLDLFAKKNELEQYKKVINNSTISAKFDLDGNITFCNDFLCQVCGYSFEELKGKPYQMLTSPNESKDFCNMIWDTVDEVGHWEGIIEKRAKNGQSYFVKESISVIYNTRGEPVEYMTIAEDVSQLKKLQLDELDRSVHRALDLHWEHLTEAIPLPTVIVDNDSEIKYHNSLFSDVAPASKGCILGKCFIEGEDYIYDDGILDWKDVAMNYEGQQKVLINDSGEDKEYYLNIKKIDNEELFLICLHDAEKCI